MQLHGMTGTQVHTPGSGFKTEKEKSRPDWEKKKDVFTVIIDKTSGC